MEHSYDIDDNKMELSRKIKHESSKYLASNKTIINKLGLKGQYTGSIGKQSGRPHGEGRMEYSCLTYDGQWIDGDWSGFGTLTNKVSGEVYEGGFFDNMRHGQCVLKYPDGKEYVGNFQFDRMGKGQMSFLDGSTFWGYYNSESIPHGRGKFNFTDGSVFDGEFENGVINGHGRMTWKDGRWYLGEWRDGDKNGHGIEVHSDGTICHEGIFCNGKAVFCERRSNEGCLLYPSSLKSGSPSTLVGPLPKRRIVIRRPFIKRFYRRN